MKEHIDFEPDTEDLLDRALASYTPVSPWLGLEDRVRARLSVSAQPSRRLPFFSWVWAVTSAFAVAIILALLLRSHLTIAPQNNATNRIGSSRIVANSAETESVMNAVPSHSYLERHSRSLRTHTHQPSQLQLIAQLLASGPGAIASLATAEKEQQTPIEVKPLAIKPLEIEPIQIKPIEEKPADAGGAL
jgi:hypothetical protein